MKSNITEDIIIVGDFNAHIGNDKEGVKDNHEKVGINGEEYRRFIRNNGLVLVNRTEKCEATWTRIQ